MFPSLFFEIFEKIISIIIILLFIFHISLALLFRAF